MEYEVLGGPADGPTLRLDHERFAYAGKFVTGRTGKAVAREGDDVVAAASFDRDRTDGSVARVRYVTVDAGRRGEGVGAKLLAFVAERLLAGDGREVTARGDRPPMVDVERVLIAVNNPFAYEAAYKAGFRYTGERTGLEELVLSRPGRAVPDSYQRGLSVFREREDVAEAERSFLDSRVGTDPPATVSTPKGA